MQVPGRLATRSPPKRMEVPCCDGFCHVRGERSTGVKCKAQAVSPRILSRAAAFSQEGQSNVDLILKVVAGIGSVWARIRSVGVGLDGRESDRGSYEADPRRRESDCARKAEPDRGDRRESSPIPHTANPRQSTPKFPPRPAWAVRTLSIIPLNPENQKAQP